MTSVNINLRKISRTLLDFKCKVSLNRQPVSQFFIFMNRGHLDGLPFGKFLVGDTLPGGEGCRGYETTSYNLKTKQTTISHSDWRPHGRAPLLD